MAVLGLEAIDVSDAVAGRVNNALRGALVRRSNVQAMPGKDLVEMRFVFGCTEEAGLGPCLSQAGKSLVVNRLIFGSIRAMPGSKRRPGGFFVRLRLLDVNTGAIEPVEVHDTVSADQIAAPNVDATANAWLTVLIGPDAPPAVAAKPVEKTPAPPAAAAPDKTPPAVAPGTSTPAAPVAAATPAAPPPTTTPPAAAVTPPPPAAPGNDIPWDDKPGRRLIAGGVVMAVLAAAALGLSAFTWRSDLAYERKAEETLHSAGIADPSYYWANPNTFAHPTCDAPKTGGPASMLIETFRGQCESARSYSDATRGLLITGSVLGVAGITAITVGLRRARADQGGKGQRADIRLEPRAGGLALVF